MKSSEEKNQFVENSWDFWNELQVAAGLDSKYDRELQDEVGANLGINATSKLFAEELKKKKVSTEALINMLLTAIQPYAMMMSNICVFFEKHAVKKSNNELKVIFDFGKGAEDLDFDLSHFRETVERFQNVVQRRSMYDLNSKKLWEIRGQLNDFYKEDSANQNVADWVANYKGDLISDLVVGPIDTGNESFDAVLNRLLDLWRVYIARVRVFGDSISESIKLMRLHSKDYSAKKNGATKSYDAEAINNILATYHDEWPRSVLLCIFGLIEKLEKQGDGLRDAIWPKIRRVEEILNELKNSTAEEIPIRDVLDVLNLPAWKRRYELYQIWVLTCIDKAFEPDTLSVHHVEGRILFRFAGSKIATLKIGKDEFVVWSEIRSEIDEPEGKGRTAHIQPDYSIYRGDSDDARSCIAVVECKQYKRGKSSNFAEALNDYAKGRPRANVFLVNYGTTPDSVGEKIKMEYRDRTQYFGMIRPGHGETKDFTDKLHEIIDLYTSVSRVIAMGDSMREEVDEEIIAIGIDTRLITAKTVALDISQSLDKVFKQSLRYNRLVKFIHQHTPTARWLAFDDSLKVDWDKRHEMVMEGLRIISDNGLKGGTNLKDSLADVSHEKLIIITDKDGVAQAGEVMEFASTAFTLEGKEEICLLFVGY